MKHTKIFLFVAALCATTMAVSANVIEIANFNWIDDADTTSTVADKTVEKDGITLKFNGRIADATHNGVTYRTLRVYAEQTLTISCADKITKIEVIGMVKKGANITASAGTVVGGDYSSQTKDIYKYENGFDDPLFVVNGVNATSTVITPVKQLRVYGIRVTTGDMTVAEALAMANALGEDEKTSQAVTVVGYVSQIKTAYSTQYSNVSFYMSDDATATTASQGDFLAFRVKGDDAATVKVGDKVKVTAQLTNYKGNIPETVAGGTVVILEQADDSGDGDDSGAGDGSDDVSGAITVAEAIAIIDGLEAGGQTDVEYTLQGKITEIMTKAADVPTYGNISLKLTDATGTIACFYTQNVGNVKFTSADEVPNLGAEVIIKGKLKKFAKTASDGTETYTPEMVNGYIVKIISNEEPTVKEVTVAEAIEVINALANNASTTDLYIVSGTVKSIITTADNIAKYGNCDFYMTDGTNEIQAFRTNGYDGAAFTDGLIKVGDQVKVKGALTKYVGSDGTVIPEINKGDLVECIPSDDSGDDSEQDGPEVIYDGYYKSIHGLSGDDLLWAIYKVISVHDSLSYDKVRGDRTNADLRGDGTIWDIYSNCSLSTSNYCNNTNYDTKTECECHNREHILPKSWWGGAQDCRYSDLVNVYPTDNATNQQRSAWCYGNVTSKTWSNSLGTKLGTGKVGSWIGTVFEPIDEYKGDVARIYCYMVACYLERQYNLGGKGFVVFNYNNSRCGFTNNGLNWMLGWHRLDPVSSKEKERNTVVLNKQKNRNPFVDFPNLVEYIWGNKKGEKFYVNSAATTASDNADALTVTTISGLYTENGHIVCDGDFQIFDLLGRNITRLNGSLCGVYIVKVGEKVQKVVVK